MNSRGRICVETINGRGWCVSPFCLGEKAIPDETSIHVIVGQSPKYGGHVYSPQVRGADGGFFDHLRNAPTYSP